jgi:hypothetical protein
MVLSTQLGRMSGATIRRSLRSLVRPFTPPYPLKPGQNPFSARSTHSTHPVTKSNSEFPWHLEPTFGLRSYQVPALRIRNQRSIQRHKHQHSGNPPFSLPTKQPSPHPTSSTTPRTPPNKPSQSPHSQTSIHPIPRVSHCQSVPALDGCVLFPLRGGRVCRRASLRGGRVCCPFFWWWGEVLF